MSNFGQVALTIVGAVVGYIIGGPTGALYGSQLGYLGGTFLFPTVLPPVSGPRLGDHATTSSSLGDPIVIGYGVFPTSGTVIFLDAVVEHATTTKQGGKGAPTQKQTTYSYTQSIAIGLCETTSMLGTNNPILGIQRIWENGELVYDTRPRQPNEISTIEHGHDSGGFDPYAERLKANAKYAETFVLYLGTEDQTPDPTIELQQGVGTTLSYRGLAYIVYPNRQLRSDQGTRHPTFKFEILASATTVPTIVEPTYLSGARTSLIQIPYISLDLNNLRYYIWDAAGGGHNATIIGMSLPDNTEFAYNDSLTNYGVLSGNAIAVSPDGAVITCWFDGGSSCKIARLDGSTLTVIGQTSYPIASASWQMYGTATVNFGAGPQYILAAVGVLHTVTLTDCVTLDLLATFTYTDHPRLAAGPNESGNAVFWVLSNTPSTSGPTGGDIAIHKIVVNNAGVTSTLTHTIAPADIDPTWGYIQTMGDMIVDPSDGHIVFRVRTGAGPTTEVYIVKMNPTTGAIDWATGMVNGANYDFAINQSHVSGNTWWLADESGTEAYFAINLSTGVIDTVSLAAIPGMSAMGGATVTSTSFNGGAILAPLFGGANGWSLIMPAMSVAGNVKIADIVADLCNRSGLTEHDTTSLGDETVEGFVLASTPMTARDAIIPLRSVGFFDGVESGDTLKFIKRGGAPKLTFGVDDIGAFESGTTEDPAPANSVTISMESDLPQQIRVSYMSPDRNYQPGQQLSPVRFDTESQNIMDVQLGGVCITDDQGAQVSEILWNDSWESDHSFTFAVDQSFAALEPTDVVLLPMQGTLYRVRILTIDDASQVMRSMTAVTDDDGNYVSTAVAQTQPVAITMKFNASSSLILMDSPLLQDADDTGRLSAPMYSAVFPSNDNSWIGATILDSPDGSSYSTVATATNAADSGLATTILGDTTEPFVTDTVNSVTVQMTGSFTLPSTITDAAFLAGGNAAALIDSDGAIEIFQFRDVTVVSSDTVTLSYLARGRRGSESMTGNHAVGSRFVMLTTGTIQKEDLNLAYLAATLQWKAVGSNDILDDVTAVPFISNGRSLMPRAPWNTRTTLSGSDILIMADRRSRIENNSAVGFSSPTLPLNEDSESYQVDIFDAPGTSVVRTLSGTSLPITYAAADVTADFGGTPATLWLAVYQMSGQVGRGFTHKINVGVPT